MRLALQLLWFLSFAGVLNATGPYDGECGTDPSNLWLDVVIVVDNSKNMTSINLQLALSDIIKVFEQKTRIGTNYTDPRSTRVALVTYNQDATVAANLNKFQSFEDLFGGARTALFDVVPTDQSFLEKGLTAAEQVFAAGRFNNYRSNYKQLVIVYAATYQNTTQSDPVIVADRLKNNGVNIAVVDMKSYEDDETVANQLYNIATDQYFFFYDSASAGLVLNTLFTTNCFCRDSWTLFPPAGSIKASGICAKVYNQNTTWQIAKLSCPNHVPLSYLVTDFTADKHWFITDLFKNATGLIGGFHNGLHYMSGDWYWDQPAGYPTVRQRDPDDVNWNLGYPKSATTNTGVADVVLEDSKGGYFYERWENINIHTSSYYYICEVDACDVYTYCP